MHAELEHVKGNLQKYSMDCMVHGNTVRALESVIQKRTKRLVELEIKLDLYTFQTESIQN